MARAVYIDKRLPWSSRISVNGHIPRSFGCIFIARKLLPQILDGGGGVLDKDEETILAALR